MNERIIDEEDLKKTSDWPIECVFGRYDERPSWEYETFPDLIQALCEGKGYNDDEEGLNFWDELDDYDKAHEKRFDVECYAVDDECHLSYAEFYQYMKLACERYAQRYASAREPLERSLAAYKERFL